jgi:uncharacterized UBP type Zn finger protein
MFKSLILFLCISLPYSFLFSQSQNSFILQGFQQHDMHEALLNVIDLAGLDTLPALHDLFRGQLETVISCGHCQGTVKRVDTFLDLSVPFAPTLEAALSNFGSPSVVDDWVCDLCHFKHPTTSERMHVVRTPEVLMVHVKRFTGNGAKINGHIQFSERIRLLNDDHYDLFAVSSHLGSTLQSGHYIAHCKISNTWVEFDDTRLYSVSLSDVLGVDAFVLFYRRIWQPNDVRLQFEEHEIVDDDDSRWVVPALWWLRFRSYSYIEPITERDWDSGGIVVGVGSRVAQRYGGIARSDYVKWMRRKKAK